MEDERVLIRACADGASGQWERFVGQYGRLITSTAAAVRAKSPPHLCEMDDLVAYVYEKLLEDQGRRLRAWRGRAKFSTYLVHVSRNLCIDLLRKSGKEDAALGVARKGPVDPPDLHGYSLEEEEWRDVQRNALREAIDELRPRQRMIIRLRLKGKSLRDIARAMKLPRGTVFVENSRAIERLRGVMGPNEKGVGP